MKARNKYEKYIDTLVAELKPITEKDKDEAFRKTFKQYYIKVKSRTKHICLECGEAFDSTRQDGYEVCPHCGKRGEIVTAQPGDSLRYFAILERVQDLQVIRYFFLCKWYKYEKAHTSCLGEVAQYWLREDGKEAVRALQKHTLGAWFNQPWNFNSEMSFKNKSRKPESYYYNVDDYDYRAEVKVRSLIPYLKRYGYKKTGHTPYTTLQLLFTSPHHATLYETGQLSIFGHTSKASLDTGQYTTCNGRRISLWQIAKVCTRHGCIIKDFIIWRDIIDSYEKRGRDLLSPKYICIDSKELKKVHNRVLRQRQRRERLERISRGESLMHNKKELKFANREYKRMQRKYLDIVIESDGIIFKPLQNIEEFYAEGKAMSHCVYTNRYYTKQESLILSATRAGKRLATIEISKHPFRILQCFAAHDKIPKENKKLRSIIENNEKAFQIKAS